MEKPQYYDLIIDLSTSTPSKSSRPALYMSKPTRTSSTGKKKPSWKLEAVRYTWSDVKIVGCSIIIIDSLTNFCSSGPNLIAF